ncbi:histone-like nucleoid-structuring protein Lsr2 [Streptomyces sp. NPDC005047]
MAQKVRVILLDDLINDGETEAAETVQFGLDGVQYEIDLTKENAHVLRSRLKEFTQAGRTAKNTGRRPARPMTEPAGPGATLSRHQGGVDPKAARTWATEQGLIEPGQRGVLGARYKDAYKAFQRGDTGPLDRLKAELATPDQTPTPRTTLRPASDPALQAAKTAENKATEPAHDATDQPPADPKEAEARQHYKPLSQRDGLMADDKKWKRRTASGEKVEDLTLVARIELLTDFNLKVLGGFLGIVDRKKDGKINGLQTSVGRLQNLEMIECAPGTDDGWVITDFGRYAYEVHSLR